MKLGVTLVTGLALAGTLATTAMSDGHGDKAAMAAIKARQASMQLYAFNIGILGAMAKGAVDYDADAASAAAGNLAALSSLNARAMWPKGSDNEAMGDATRALPAIWTDGHIGEKAMAMASASAALAETAGDGIDGLRGGIGAVGKACGACHDAYRQPK